LLHVEVYNLKCFVVSTLQLVIAADVGNSFSGDIAVDDFKLNQYPCKLGKFTLLEWKEQIFLPLIFHASHKFVVSQLWQNLSLSTFNQVMPLH